MYITLEASVPCLILLNKPFVRRSVDDAVEDLGEVDNTQHDRRNWVTGHQWWRKR